MSRERRSHMLSRRAVLRGVGAATIALPLLESVSCLGGTAAGVSASPKRAVFICAGLGFHAQNLFPKQVGKLKAETPYLAELADHFDQCTLLSGLSHPEQQGNNGHASGLTFLTSAQRPGLAGFKNTISLDQRIAQHVGLETRFPYLALSTRNGSSLSWTASGVSIPGESSPAKLFKRLFVAGTKEEIQKELSDLRRGRSVLDTVATRAKQLQPKVSTRDREKVEQYLSSVRELEQRLQESEGWVQREKPKVEAAIPEDIADRDNAIERQRLLYDMVVLALQTDSTRTVTLELGGLNSVPKVQGVSSDWHNLSHHGKDPEKIKELQLIEAAEFKVFSEFLSKLKRVAESDGSLLDNTAVLFGSNLGNASSHDWHNLPIVMAGGGYRHGNYIAHDAKNNTPLANLFVSMGQHMGLELEQFGSSTAAGVNGLTKS